MLLLKPIFSLTLFDLSLFRISFNCCLIYTVLWFYSFIFLCFFYYFFYETFTDWFNGPRLAKAQRLHFQSMQLCVKYTNLRTLFSVFYNFFRSVRYSDTSYIIILNRADWLWFHYKTINQINVFLAVNGLISEYIDPQHWNAIPYKYTPVCRLATSSKKLDSIWKCNDSTRSWTPLIYACTWHFRY